MMTMNLLPMKLTPTTFQHSRRMVTRMRTKPAWRRLTKRLCAASLHSVQHLLYQPTSVHSGLCVTGPIPSDPVEFDTQRKRGVIYCSPQRVVPTTNQLI